MHVDTTISYVKKLLPSTTDKMVLFRVNQEPSILLVFCTYCLVFSAG